MREENREGAWGLQREAVDGDIDDQMKAVRLANGVLDIAIDNETVGVT